MASGPCTAALWPGSRNECARSAYAVQGCPPGVGCKRSKKEANEDFRSDALVFGVMRRAPPALRPTDNNRTRRLLVMRCTWAPFNGCLG